MYLSRCLTTVGMWHNTVVVSSDSVIMLVSRRSFRVPVPPFHRRRRADVLSNDAGDSNVAKVLVITSGKGGVGKTTTTAALGAALAQAGQNVAVVDFDVGLRNLDLVMGAERRVVFDLINVVQGVAKLSQALIRDKRLENLWLL